ncbi:MAG: hypothetical protein GY813_03410, partial [Halieaceae bacterium]|nr:hypothetical protein [Halieaceae bacterium]
TGYDSRYLWLSHTAVIGSRSFVDTILSAGRVGNDRNMTAVETDESIALADERSVDIYTLQQDWQHEPRKGPAETLPEVLCVHDGMVVDQAC